MFRDYDRRLLLSQQSQKLIGVYFSGRHHHFPLVSTGGGYNFDSVPDNQIDRHSRGKIKSMVKDVNYFPKPFFVCLSL